MKKTFSLLIENKGVILPQITNIFARRGLTILSLSMSETDLPQLSRLSLQVDCSSNVALQVVGQLSTLVSVLNASLLEPEETISSHLMLLKVSATVKTRQEILTIIELTGASVASITPSTLTLQATGNSDFLDNILTLLQPYDILEVARSGAVALPK